MAANYVTQMLPVYTVHFPLNEISITINIVLHFYEYVNMNKINCGCLTPFFLKSS